MAAKHTTGNWSENDFEEWFCRRQQLPDGEPVLVIARQRALRRVPDLVALDADGGLIINEVKNEAATRQAVGQALEYLALYANVTVDDLDDDYRTWKGEKASLRADYLARFGYELKDVSKRRRVYLVAPKFDPASSISASYLTELFMGSQVSFALLSARRTGRREFEISVYHPAITLPKDLSGFVTNARGRLFYVVEPGPAPIIWNIGRRTDSGELKRTTSHRLSHRALRVATKPMILHPEGVPEVNLRDLGTTWCRKNDRHVHARVIGAIKIRGTELVVAAKYKNGSWLRFFQLEPSNFESRYERCDVDLPGWKSILSDS